jgi:hypothetical protein
MHLETLAYMLHQLPLDQKIPQADPPAPPSAAFTKSMIRIPAGLVTLGFRAIPKPSAGITNSPRTPWPFRSLKSIPTKSPTSSIWSSSKLEGMRPAHSGRRGLGVEDGAGNFSSHFLEARRQ